MIKVMRRNLICCGIVHIGGLEVVTSNSLGHEFDSQVEKLLFYA